MNQLSSFCALFDVHDDFLLALLELCAFTVKFSLSFGQWTLVLTESFCGSDCATKERLLGIIETWKRKGDFWTYDKIHWVDEAEQCGYVTESQMDLPQIGAHCSLSACNILDFLPIKCRCHNLYCSAHINPDHHSCLASSTVSLSPNATELHACVLDGCKKARLSKEETCSACHGLFCVECIFHLI